MFKPTFSALQSNHYSGDTSKPNSKTAEEVYKEIGRSDLYVKYPDTCALRMSLALLKSGVSFTGRKGFDIRDGPHKGTIYEPGAIGLAEKLKTVFGTLSPFVPEKKSASGLSRVITFQPKNVYFTKRTSVNMENEILEYLKRPGCGHGVIFFKDLRSGYGYDGGHIDLIELVTAAFMCNSHCYPLAEETWYWPLP
jgi:hypothetical protein